MNKYEVKSVVALPDEDIDLIQNRIDAENLEIAQQAYNNGQIPLEDFEYLQDFYTDSPSVYREVYQTLVSIFNTPEATCAMDLSTGKVDVDEQGNHIDYTLRALTPFTCTRLEYFDEYHNPLYIMFPPMKSATRAVEKLEKEYGKESFEEMKKASEWVFRHEDYERYREALGDITKSSKKLHDIVRFTITCKYLKNVKDVAKRIKERGGPLLRYDVNDKETRDRFLLPLEENEKKYYDVKMIMHHRNEQGKLLDVEIQLKVHTLSEADFRTHSLYEEIRQLKAELKNRSNDESLEARQKTARMLILTDKTRKYNQNAIHQYNMMVVDKVRRIESDKYIPLRWKPDAQDETYRECREFIKNSYLVESEKEFDAQTAFSEKDINNKLAFLRLLGKFEPDFDEFAVGSEDLINRTFAQLTSNEMKRFDDINKTAQRYASIIQERINNRPLPKTENKVLGSIIANKKIATK